MARVHIPADLRRLVLARANAHCEYCLIHQDEVPFLQIIVLFNPRLHVWGEHFALNGPFIVGQTPMGRATARLLRLNDSKRILQRQTLIAVGRYPLW
jgi:hypothetical protein